MNKIINLLLLVGMSATFSAKSMENDAEMMAAIEASNQTFQQEQQKAQKERELIAKIEQESLIEHERHQKEQVAIARALAESFEAKKQEQKNLKKLSDSVLAEPLKIWKSFKFDKDTLTPLETKVYACDEQNKQTKFENLAQNGRNIVQFPALFQNYPGFENYHYCGFYAAYFAHCMAISSDKELVNRLNNRQEFYGSLQNWFRKIRETRDSENLNDLNAKEIKSLIAMEDTPNNIIINGITDEEINFFQQIPAMKNSAQFAPKIFVMNTSNNGSHWIVVKLEKQNNQIKLIIADPLAINRTNAEFISSFYDQFVSENKVGYVISTFSWINRHKLSLLGLSLPGLIYTCYNFLPNII